MTSAQPGLVVIRSRSTTRRSTTSTTASVVHAGRTASPARAGRTGRAPPTSASSRPTGSTASTGGPRSACSNERLPGWVAEVDGRRVHYARCDGVGPDPLPLVLLHGWPGSYAEMYKVAPLLADPGAHGGDPADAFDVIVPSLPGSRALGSSARTRLRRRRVQRRRPRAHDRRARPAAVRRARWRPRRLRVGRPRPSAS